MALEDCYGSGGGIGIRGCCCQGLSETCHRRLVTSCNYPLARQHSDGS